MTHLNLESSSWWCVECTIDPALPADAIGLPRSHWRLADEPAVWLTPPGELQRGAPLYPRRVRGGWTRVSSLHPLDELRDVMWLGRTQRWLAGRWAGVRDMASGRVARLPTVSARVALYWLTEAETSAGADANAVADAAPLRRLTGVTEARHAHECGVIGIRTLFDCRGRRTTLGRLLVAEVTPEPIRERAERVLDARALAALLEACARQLGCAEATGLLERLDALGAEYQHFVGSLAAIGLAHTSEVRRDRVADFRAHRAEIEAMYTEGMITDGERFNRIIDAGAYAHQAIRVDIRRRVAADPGLLGLMTRAGVMDERHTGRLLAGHGTLAWGSGELMEEPVLRGLADGITGREAFFVSTTERCRSLNEQERARRIAHLWQRLASAIGDIEIVADDCGTRDGQTRVLPDSTAASMVGRVLARDVLEVHGGVDPDRARAILTPADAVIDEAMVEAWRAADVRDAVVRTVTRCRAVGGPCARCYGVDPATGLLPWVGARVGARAARAVADTAVALPLTAVHHIC